MSHIFYKNQYDIYIIYNIIYLFIFKLKTIKLIIYKCLRIVTRWTKKFNQVNRFEYQNIVRNLLILHLKIKIAISTKSDLHISVLYCIARVVLKQILVQHTTVRKRSTQGKITVLQQPLVHTHYPPNTKRYLYTVI